MLKIRWIGIVRAHMSRRFPVNVRILFLAAVILSSCQIGVRPPSPDVTPSGDSISSTDRSAILALVPKPSAGLKGRSIWKISTDNPDPDWFLTDDIRRGDVVVRDEYSGGSSSWLFRKVDGKWQQIAAVGDID